MNSMRNPPTSDAATRKTEPEIVAGISSAEGQPVAFEFESAAANSLRPRLMMCGAAAVLGLVAGVRICRFGRSGAPIGR
jgi:hypothetical protein